MDHFGRQYRCARVCADRNRDVRRSSIKNAEVQILSGDMVPSPSSHQIIVRLPGVDSSAVSAKIVGDILTIKASRTWTRDLIAEATKEHKKCDCKDIAEEVLGKTDEFVRQLRVPESVAKDKVSVEMRKETDELVISLPDKEPETIEFAVHEV
mmetsp:Transcript_17108/g.32528  ORF Transcript_17108/g.32528 Transcript_17108/m.32528 type:complete len:153 (-) Transcript_17108:110-568(-)